jgi:hypothetical protein
MEAFKWPLPAHQFKCLCECLALPDKIGDDYCCGLDRGDGYSRVTGGTVHQDVSFSQFSTDEGKCRVEVRYYLGGGHVECVYNLMLDVFLTGIGDAQ